MKRSLPLSILAAAAALCVSAACGSASKPASTTTPSSGGGSSATSGASSSVPSTPVNTAAVTAALRVITLQRSDLPPGWTATAYQPDPSNAVYQAALVRCVGGRDTSADRVAEAHSPDYSQRNATISPRRCCSSPRATSPRTCRS
jgi:hypothetical protein